MPDNFITIVLSGHTLGYSVLHTKGEKTSSEIVRIEDIPSYVAALAAKEMVHIIKIVGPTSFALPFCEDILTEASTQYGYNNLEIEVL